MLFHNKSFLPNRGAIDLQCAQHLLAAGADPVTETFRQICYLTYLLKGGDGGFMTVSSSFSIKIA